ncbi:MAG: hypothetical protein WBG47_06470 [Gordonia sp. (in: high G+C Gram-positive bacteria)]|uniref:hypothetical protein n=1 Tax=Gordonia sp. (in: high G+C Gram-positive bacteria) TaxID=84139 RepID=UPI003C71CE0F
MAVTVGDVSDVGEDLFPAKENVIVGEAHSEPSIDQRLAVALVITLVGFFRRVILHAVALNDQ